MTTTIEAVDLYTLGLEKEAEFAEIDKELADTYQAVKDLSEMIEAAEEDGNVRRALKTRQELDLEREVLLQLQEKRKVMQQTISRNVYQEQSRMNGDYMDEVKERQKPLYDQAQALFEQLQGVLGELEKAETAAKQDIERANEALTPYITQEMARNLKAGEHTLAFYGLKSQKEALEKAFKAFQV